jgi:hypothetical protein
MKTLELGVDLEDKLLSIGNDHLTLSPSLYDAEVFRISIIDWAVHLKYKTSDENLVERELEEVSDFLNAGELSGRIEVNASFPEGEYPVVSLVGNVYVNIHGRGR